jgi:TrkA domain protein
MKIKETDLPGIGKKFSFDTEAHETLVMVIHHTGKREIYRFLEDKENPHSLIELTDEEARNMGAILSGAYFQPAPEGSMALIAKELTIEWVRVDARSPLRDRTLRELALRERTGASIVAIMREDRLIPNPLPDERIQERDTLMAVGNLEQVRNFVRFSKQTPD